MLLLAGLLAGGCSPAVRWDEPPASRGRTAADSRQRPAEHVVRAGETLYAIAFRYGLDVKSLARWNQLGDGTLIRVGQRLRLAPPGASAGVATGPGRAAAGAERRAPAPAVPPPRWLWPTEGAVLRSFGATPQTQSGIHIGGRLGQPVVAAADGQVVYSGSGLVGYGELIIIKHSESWLTAYGYNQALLVREGDAVRAGQLVARMGEGPGRAPALHFEIRRDGSPVDPARLLPGR